MDKRIKYSLEEKEKIVKKILDGKMTLKEANVSHDLLNQWIRRYRAQGIEGLKNHLNWKNYSKEIKLKAISEFENGISMNNIVDKYDISDKSILRRWIKKYNSHKELKDSRGENSIMTKGRKISFEEKLEAIKFCLENQKNYHKTTEIFRISYQQIYMWVKKYEEIGEKGLEDRRGKSKLEFTEKDQILITMRKLEKENERLRAENLLLKKLEELKRR